MEIRTCTAFCGTKRIATGGLQHVALDVKAVVDRDPAAPVLIFDDATSEPVEVDLRGTPQEVAARIEAAEPPPAPEEGEVRRPGRPKLGVVAREVTLLPRQWEWLASRPGGASVTLRRLVDQARQVSQGQDRRRRAQESAYRFLTAMAGNEPGYEEAIRALFAGNPDSFDELIETWPADVRDHAKKLAKPAFEVQNGLQSRAEGSDS